MLYRLKDWRALGLLIVIDFDWYGCYKASWSAEYLIALLFFGDFIEVRRNPLNCSRLLWGSIGELSSVCLVLRTEIYCGGKTTGRCMLEGDLIRSRCDILSSSAYYFSSKASSSPPLSCELKFFNMTYLIFKVGFRFWTLKVLLLLCYC